MREAVKYLENPSLLIRMANALGQPLESFTKGVVPAKVVEVANNALRKAMAMAAGSVWGKGGGDRSLEEAFSASGWTSWFHTAATVGTGMAGGIFGLPGLAVELPVTTGIMFRAITSIAADFGEDLQDPTVRLECLTVFSHGGPAPDAEGLESSYLMARVGMAKLIEEAAIFLTRESSRSVAEALARGTAPTLIHLLSRVAARFNVTVSQKFLAQSLPLVGGLTGAAINGLFTDHFNAVARYHFGIRKLERVHGVRAIQDLYRAELRQLRSK